jgi:hypothetical protein
VSLGVIMLLALVIRPLVAKPVGRSAPAGPNDADDAVRPAPFSAPAGSSSIIQFPNLSAIEEASKPPAWDELDPLVADRFSRVVGDGDRRQRPIERRADRTPRDLATAAIHRIGPESVDPMVTRRPSPPAPIVPFPVPAHYLEEEARFRPAGVAAGAYSKVENTNLETAISSERGAVEGVDESATSLNGHSESAIASAGVEHLDGPVSFGSLSSGGEPDVTSIDLQWIDTPTLAALHQVVRELIYCANSGQLLHGFALYSDPFLFRFMDDTGLSEGEFRDAFGSVSARPREEWEHLDLLTDVERLPDGRIEATASYVDVKGAPVNGIERYRFIRVETGWQIDDISALDRPG